MTDVYVALKRLKRKGKSARVLPDRNRRAVPSFNQTWAAVDRLATMYPDRVVHKGAESADR